jgi:hypothetical protein
MIKHLNFWRPIAITLVISAMVGCGSVPADSKNPGALGVHDNCDSELGSVGGFAPGDPSPAQVTLVAVETLGMSFAAYAICERYSRLTPAPVSTLYDGSYRSADGTISVALPGPLAHDGQPGIQVWQGDPSFIQKVYFASTQARGTVYGIYVLHFHFFSDADLYSLNELEHEMFHTAYDETSGVVPDVKLEYLYKENVGLRDGTPALVEVVRNRGNTEEATIDSNSPPHSGAPYLIYYLVKPHNAPDKYVVLSIFWYGSCPACTAGPETAIRNMDPSIEKFIDSFHFTNTQAADGTK